MLWFWHWVYKWMVRPVIYALTWRDPEKAHELCFDFLEWLEGSPRRLAWLDRVGRHHDSRIIRRIDNITFNGLVGLAAGFSKNAQALRALCAMFDFVVVGTVTPARQEGFNRPRIWRIFQHSRILLLNRMGFPNEGAEKVAVRLRDYYERFGPMPVPVGVSIGAQATTGPEGAVNDYLTVYRIMRELADDMIDCFKINISSPNTDWLRILGTQDYSEVFLTELMRRIRELNIERGWQPKPLLVKVSPDMKPEELQNLAAVSSRVGITALAATNTTMGRDGLSGRVVKMLGGLSGWYVQPQSLKTVRHLHECDPGLVIIGVGGIDSYQTACQFEVAGASLFEIYTGFFAEFPLLAREINADYSRRLN